MVVKRYPHTATLSYVADGTINSIGIWSMGTLTSIAIICNIQPSGKEATFINDAGIVISYSWDISCQPNSGFSSVPDGAKLEFFSKDHVLKQLFEYQTHAELKC